MAHTIPQGDLEILKSRLVQGQIFLSRQKVDLVRAELERKHKEGLEAKEESLRELRYKSTVLESERDNIARGMSIVSTKAQEELRRAQAARKDESTTRGLSNRDLEHQLESLKASTGAQMPGIDFTDMDSEQAESKVREASVKDDQYLSHYVQVPVPMDISYKELRNIIMDEFPNRDYSLQSPKEIVEGGHELLLCNIVFGEQATAMSRIIENRIHSRVVARADPEAYPERLLKQFGLGSIPQGGASSSSREFPPRAFLSRAPSQNLRHPRARRRTSTNLPKSPPRHQSL